MKQVKDFPRINAVAHDGEKSDEMPYREYRTWR